MSRPGKSRGQRRPYELRFQHAKYFMEYLENAELQAEAHTKDSMKDVYNIQYKAYLRQENPVLRWESFSNILFTLRRQHQIGIIGNNIRFKESRPPIRVPLQRVPIVATGLQNDLHNGQDDILLGAARLAVDQHVTGARLFGNVPVPHLQTDSKRDRQQRLLKQLRVQSDHLIKDKDDITIRTEHDHHATGCICVDFKENEAVTVQINIKNCGREDIMFTHCEMLKQMRVFTFSDSGLVTDGIRTERIPAGSPYMVTLTARARHIGQYLAPLAFVFTKCNQPETAIHIIRYLSFQCYNELTEQLKPKAPYKPPSRITIANTPKVEQVDGYPLASEMYEGLEREVTLDRYLIPHSLRKLMNHGLAEKPALGDSYGQTRRSTMEVLSSDLSGDNYHERFSLLLHIEEIQMEVDIRRYDRDNEPMKVCRERTRLMTLTVPGLAEKRPSVLKGDHLFVQKMIDATQSEKIEYKGYVHDVRLNEIWLGFSERLRNSFFDGMKFNIRFTFNRVPLMLQHRSTVLAENNQLSSMLFPTAATVRTIPSNPLAGAQRLIFYDRLLENNTEQREAVQHIVAGSSRPAPYLVFGPPGTGKTVTIVEAIKQIVKLKPSAHILACAPSNSAADLIAERLVTHIGKAEIFRMMAFSRSWNNVPEKVKEADICNYDKTSGNFYFPKKETLQKYRVLVCTLVTAGRIASAKFPPGHFTHVFIDEAGHAIEPESVIAIAGTLSIKDGGQLVLAGDPKQLGPILRSPVAIKHGLGISLLERLMSRDVYSRILDSYDSRIITKLIRNYRSHPSILKVPNECFYDNELEIHADQLVRESMCRWEGLPKKGFPIVFRGVKGKDEREERSPSFFNRHEVAEVTRYIEELFDAKGIKLNQKDIGVISPYRKQVEKIREVFKKKLWKDIKVGSVEEFQGQERKVIIISTVRSSKEFLPLDTEFKLGFLRNPKRFNVAVTRAKALLIVVGNPFLLARDEHWKIFLDYCRSKEGYTGCDYDDAEDEIEDVMQRLAAAKLDDLETEQQAGNGVGESVRQQQEDPEWRGEN